MRGFRTFLVLCFGESLSVLGTQLTGFTLGVWALEHTDSVTWYALFAVATIAPRLVLAPVAGIWVDRYDRRRVLLFGHTASGLCSLALYFLFLTGAENLLGVLALVAVSSLLGAGQYPAFQASTTLLVESDRLPRANGFVHLGLSIAHTVAPVVAGLSMARIGIAGVIVIDVLTFVTASVLLLRLRIPSPQRTELPSERDPAPLTFGWRFIRHRPSLSALLLLFASLNFCLGAAQMLLGPLVLAMADEAALGRVLGQAGLGMLLGSLAMTVWAPRHRLVPRIAILALLQGLALAALAVASGPLWIGVFALLAFFTRPLLSACSATLWQRKVAARIQGRVFAFRSAVVQGTLPLAYLIAGPSADVLFEPAMAPGALGARWLGGIIGVGPGRGVALLLLVLAFGILAAALVTRIHAPLWQLESRLPGPGSDRTEPRH